MRKLYLLLPLVGALVAGVPDSAVGQGLTATHLAPAAADSRALLERPVKLALRRAPLREALDEIARQASLPLSYSPEVLPAAKRVTLAYSEIGAGDALHEVLRGTGLQVSIFPTGQIAVLPEPPSDPGERPD